MYTSFQSELLEFTQNSESLYHFVFVTLLSVLSFLSLIVCAECSSLLHLFNLLCHVSLQVLVLPAEGLLVALTQLFLCSIQRLPRANISKRNAGKTRHWSWSADFSSLRLFETGQHGET